VQQRFTQIINGIIRVFEGRLLPDRCDLKFRFRQAGRFDGFHLDLPVEIGQRRFATADEPGQCRVGLFDEAIGPLQQGRVATLGGLQQVHGAAHVQPAHRIVVFAPFVGVVHRLPGRPVVMPPRTMSSPLCGAGDLKPMVLGLGWVLFICIKWFNHG